MILFLRERTIHVILYFFVFLYPYLIYPWGGDYYYANVKVYYFMGFMMVATVWSFVRSKSIVYSKESITDITATEWALAFFLFLNGCSTLQSLNVSLVGNLTEHQGIIVMITYATLFVIATRCAAREAQRNVILLMVLSSFLVALYGILQHFQIDLLPQNAKPEFQFGSRIYSLFDNPDYFGSYLTLLLLLTITYFISTKDRVREILFFMVLCALYLSLLYSETRSAWLGSLIGFIILSYFVIIKRRHVWRKLGLLLITFILLFNLANTASRHSYSSRAVTIAHDANKIITNSNSNSAGASRWYIWKISFPLIKKHFWLGSGPNTFRYVFHPGIDPEYKKQIGKATIYDENNDYLQIALTMGVPALIVYLLFLIMILYSGFNKAKQLTGDQQILTYGMLAAIVGYLIQAFFNISVVSVAPYFWLLLGFVYSRSSESRLRTI